MAENHTAAAATSDPKDPASFLSSIIGVPVTVKLNSGVVYKGELQSVDGYMNIALEKCAEYVEGKLRRRYGDAFVRGNNGTLCLICLVRNLWGRGFKRWEFGRWMKLGAKFGRILLTDGVQCFI